MTKYVGETFEWLVTGDDFDGTTELDTSIIASVEISIYDAAGEVVVDATPMTYDTELDGWTYLWATADLDPGRYTAKVVATGSGDTVSIEFKSTRLRARRVGD